MYDLITKEIQGILNNRNPIKQQIKKCKRWTDNGFIYIYEELALKIIMDCRVPTTVEFRTKLGFNKYDIMINKEQWVLTKKKRNYLRKKKYCYNILFWTIKLICIFLSVN